MSDVCDAFEQLQAHVPYNMIVFAKAVLCWAGAIFVVMQAYRRGVAWLVHANSKMIFAHYYFILAFQGAIYGLFYTFEFTRLRFECTQLDFRIPLTMRTAGNAAVMASHYIMVALSIERLISSIWPLKFEKCTSRLYGIIIGSSVIVISFVIIFYSFTDEFRLLGQVKYVVKLDIRNDQNKAAYDLTLTLLAYGYIPSSLVFALDIYLNFYKNRNSSNCLATNYQYSENRKVICIIWPLEVLNALVTIFASVAQPIFNRFNPSASDIERALLVECTALSTLFPLAFSAIIEWRVGFRKERTIEQLQPSQVTHSYFSALAADWNKKEKETDKKSRFVKIFKSRKNS